MTERIGWRALARFLAGESPPEERARIESWATDARHREIMEGAHRAWDATADGSPLPDTDASWRRLAARIQAERAHRLPPRLAWGLTAAAVLAALVAIPLVRSRLAAPPPAAAYATGPGQLLTVHLDDGSVVQLAPMTNLRAVRAGGREAWLQGTAFFAVARRDDRPFTVHTAGGDARVLGTRFELRAQAQRVQLVVLEGKVALTGSWGREVVGAGEESDVEPGRAPSRPRAADVSRMTRWMNGVLIFQATPLAEAAREIQRQYHVPIRLSDPVLAQRTVSAVFDHQPLGTVAMTICRIADATCDVQDSIVWIRP